MCFVAIFADTAEEKINASILCFNPINNKLQQGLFFIFQVWASTGVEAKHEELGSRVPQFAQHPTMQTALLHSYVWLAYGPESPKKFKA